MSSHVYRKHAVCVTDRGDKRYSCYS